MIFMLLFYADEQAMAAMSRSERNELVERHVRYRFEVLERRQVGILEVRALDPSATAVTVRPRDGGMEARQGPFDQPAEALTGFYLLDCPDMDAAVELAKAYPMPEGVGCLEVRPVMRQWEYEPSIEADASPESVWALCADPSTWPEWKWGVRDVDLDAPIRAGRRGAVTTVEGERLPLRIREVREGESYAFEVDLAEGVTLPLTVRVEPRADGGSQISQRVVMPRAALELRGMDFSPQFNAGMHATLEALADRAAALDGGRERVWRRST